MAIQFSREKESGDGNTLTYPYLVVDSDAALLSRDDAIAIARDDAAALEDAVPSGYRFRRISNRAIRVDIVFSRITPQPLTIPVPGQINVDFEFSFVAQAKELTEALEWIETYDPDGATGEEIRAVNIERTGEGGERIVGRRYQPAPEVFSFNIVLPNAYLDADYKQTVQGLCGRFNSVDFTIDGITYEAGRVQLVRAAAGKRTDEDWRLSFGFGLRENRTNIDVGGGIVVPAVRGSWDYWTLQKFLVVNLPGRQFVKMLPDLAVVQRVWDEGDLNLLVPW
ncbi:MAG: hypothetical protein IT424_06465 [Pirellulales bacterium]|nr:hypothetical protein [Pirellulales bacterium]